MILIATLLIQLACASYYAPNPVNNIASYYSSQQQPYGAYPVNSNIPPSYPIYDSTAMQQQPQPYPSSNVSYVQTPVVYVSSQYSGTTPSCCSGSGSNMPAPLMSQDQINMFAMNPSVPKPPAYYAPYSPQWNQWYQQQYQMMYGAATDPYINKQAFDSCMTCAGNMGGVPSYPPPPTTF